MKISILGWCYLAFCATVCIWFCAAAIGGWPGPQFESNFGGNSYSGSSSSGYSSGRGWGGSWGGGK